MINNPVAFVTGASRGIGEAIAITLAKNGYDLIITSSKSQLALENVALKIEKLGVRCLWIASDVSSYEDTQRLFERIADYTDHLDLMVNNAACSYVGLLTDMSLETWHHILNTNLSGLFHTSKFSIPMMVAKKKGVILNISSIWGASGASCEVAYSASKGGVNTFTKALAKELAPSNIRVNAIACGVIDTPMNAWLSSSEKENLISDIGLGRMGTPQDIANMVLFLASDASAYITGQIITVDGGL
ncbi:elongation factor P 5-aminopentanone reductase [Petrocella sp. FN5]|uniref:elongation factor P 5-aminopentanone reductase n=1 Tax=Petrocella sp. FN5 TaxID=3032002 RepID=UPI0023DC7C70|nr:3-oxoacyl-ACP reductase FabG [Petrocella sp. FN5]MDF1615950.1 3-oxoacyl-ACP reductase FabG [Petrocella sp. FN5]